MKETLFDNRPIGIFDSGLGGLTALKQIKELMPNENFIYFGDTARTPYGSKAIETIQNFSVQITEFLMEHDVKMIVIACNTVTATCLNLLQDKYREVPVIGMIEPTAKYVAQNCSNENIGVIGTRVTINSNQYENMINDLNSDCSIFSVACPLFVPAIEEGVEKTSLMKEMIKHYLDGFISNNEINTLVLGCTHYPLIENEIIQVYKNLKIVNPSKIVAFEVREILQKRKTLSNKNNLKSCFYASDLSEGFMNMVKDIMGGENINIKNKSFVTEIT